MKFLFLLFMIVGCSDGEKASWSALGKPAKVKCFSGGRVIYEGESTGQIGNESQGDGYYFKEKSTGNLVEINADCVFTRDSK